MGDIDLPALRDHLIAIAIKAGSMITRASATTSLLSDGNGSGSLSTKKNSADLVTETDKAVEDFISSELKAAYPDFDFMGEETYVAGQKLGAGPTFIVDPIDGTTNFVHGWPYVSVSLGFAVGREPVVGVVFNPFTRRLYHAVKGQGSFLRTIHDDDRSGQHGGGGGGGEDRQLPLRYPAPLAGLDGCVVAIEYGSDRSGQNWRTKVDTWAALGASKDEGGAMVHSARALGSAALNLCGVAEGSLDAYWEGGCWAWDVCAGWVVLKEAGGVIVDGNPGQWEIPVDHRKYLAVRGAEGRKGQRELVEEFWGFIKGPMEYEH
jgi:myo-inositol-1(or 4)-monophosphatase